MVNKRNHVRKRRSNEILARYGIQAENLPVLKDSSELTGTKSREETMYRFLCSYLASMVSFIKIALSECNNVTVFAMEDLNRAKENAKKFGIFPHMEDDEFLAFQDFEDLDAIINPMKIEYAYILGWVLGLNQTLHFPNRACDMFFPDVMLSKTGSIGELENQIKVRDIEDVLDEYDLEYRMMHAITATVDSQNCLSDFANPDIISERHKALDWYVGNAQYL